VFSLSCTKLAKQAWHRAARFCQTTAPAPEAQPETNPHTVVSPGDVLMAALTTQYVGLEPVLNDLDAGRPVVLATSSDPASWRVVNVLAARLGRNARFGAPRVFPTAIDPVTPGDPAQVVRLYGLPYKVSDAAAVLAVELGANIYPVFTASHGLWGDRAQILPPIRPRGSTNQQLQRTAQRLAWQLERYLRHNRSRLPLRGWNVRPDSLAAEPRPPAPVLPLFRPLPRSAEQRIARMSRRDAD